ASGQPADRRACPRRLWRIRLDYTAPTSVQWNAESAILPCSTSSPWPPSWTQTPARSCTACDAHPTYDVPSRKKPGRSQSVHLVTHALGSPLLQPALTGSAPPLMHEASVLYRTYG